MIKQTFNGDGIAAKEQELYSLTPEEKQYQTNLIKTEFKTWIIDNFDLDAGQVTYLQVIDPKFIDSITYEIADSIEQEIPIVIDFPTQPIGAKFIDKSQALTYSFSQNGGLVITGGLRLTIYYQ